LIIPLIIPWIIPFFHIFSHFFHIFIPCQLGSSPFPRDFGRAILRPKKRSLQTCRSSARRRKESEHGEDFSMKNGDFTRKKWWFNGT
jgi:hypothetical protein